MKLIVGLGNPGEKYERTRHNLGFLVIDQFLRDSKPVKETSWQEDDRFKTFLVHSSWQPKHGKEEKLIMMKPKTYMNNSGLAVSLVTSFYKIKPEDIWVINDELDLPLGAIKIRFGGASAGHKGVTSIMEKLGTDKFWRFRLGIGVNRNHNEIAGQKMHNVDDFVLGTFGRGEVGKARELIKRSSKAIATGLEEGIESAQNRFNTK
ncbi:MAG: aminoacyl-tRNA hydrolase [Candidatus Levybacteria bacterium]|nr:aminoacyl-tRNA hydrolase [Candidatus Levybacteria bacterium]